MNTRTKLLSAAITSIIGISPVTTYAALSNSAIFNFTGGITVCNGGFGTAPNNCTYGTDVSTGTFFSMDTSADGTVQAGEKTAIQPVNGLKLGTTQAASGSHVGQPNGSETSDIDAAWPFFGNTGLHQTTAAITILSDDSSGNVTLDFAGWDVTWNGIASIPLAGDSANFGTYAGPNGTTGNSGIAIMSCGSTCEHGDTFSLTYAAQVPKNDPSNFQGVKYVLNMVGTIVVPNTAPVTSDFTTAGTASTPLSIDLASNTTDVDGNLDVTAVTTSASDACAAIIDNDDGTVTFPACTAAQYMFDYTIDDTQSATSNTSTVTVNISANPAPNTQSDTASTDGTTSVVIDVLANDSDPGGSLDLTSVAISSAPTGGSITNINPGTGEITYTANAIFSGDDTFMYTVDDNTAQESAPTTVTVTVNAVNVPSSDSTFALGSTASTAGSTDGVVTATDIGVVDNGSSAEQGIASNCIGGCFDFTLTGFSGTEARVVLPLSTTIPAVTAATNQMKYRKLGSAGTWNDFDDSGNDAIHTAPGTIVGPDLVCPPADDAVYDANPNLTTGHQCVRLTLVDGGPNDADGAVNGTIADPGGIAQTTVIDTRVAGTDGCSMTTNSDRNLLQHIEWLIIAGFIAILGLGRRKRSDLT